MTAIDDIKSRIDIVDLVSETVKLRRSGKNYTGFCPFHTNTRTPAFVVFPESGTWRCFGQCNEGGDIFRFVMKKEGWDFPETLRFLAEKAGVQLEPVTPQRQQTEQVNERLQGLLEEAVNFYRHHLLQTPAGQPALAYLTKRGLTQATIETFGLGYAPEGWENSLQYFRGKGYSNDEMLRAGLVTERQEREGTYDRFRNRIMFPIRDAMGHMAGFGARILDPNDVPKFLNSPQTALFDKGRLLYGLDQARKMIRSQDQVVIVEGYLDVIVLHQAGFSNAVSPMGTALTEDQMRLLKRFTRRFVLALDPDAAGDKATLRGLEIARQSLDHNDEIAFDARGLLRHEARLQADVRVTTLPPGMDPDEVVLRDPEEWRKILEAAKPIVAHVMDTLAAGRDLEDPKTKTEVAAQVLPLIEDVPSPVERDTYRQRLARMLKVDVRALQGVAPAAAPGQRRKPVIKTERPGRRTQAIPATSGQRAAAMEAHCLHLLLRQPDIIYQVDRFLQQNGLGRFSEADFELSDHQQIVHLLLESMAQDRLEINKYLQENLPDSLEDTWQALTVDMTYGEPTSEKRFEDLVRTIMDLRLLKIDQSIQQIRFLQEDLQDQEENLDLNPYQELIGQSAQARNRLEKALAKPLIPD
ncbi:DNA primase [Longilinea arvoryzae]|uniref:DNA primase n=1 Tax=Longilinea arvoryzae TaxID=360412 RepID=A0A0S7BE76_9CHLR|nr:DNA primase [Longilinea arvoryzae]GAP12274.1 DNA primase [Longilinea arvoryzae]